MNEELHADFVSHFTEFLVKYGQLLESCEKCKKPPFGGFLLSDHNRLFMAYNDFWINKNPHTLFMPFPT